MRMKRSGIYVMGLMLLLLVSVAFARAGPQNDTLTQGDQARGPLAERDTPILDNARDMISEGRQTFRFDTFGDEAFWGDALKLHRAIAGANLGGVGPGLSPRAALALGLKVDVDALPRDLIDQLEAGQVNLDDPAVTLAWRSRTPPGQRDRRPMERSRQSITI